ncbi:MAG: hypothetical protein VX350_05245 [Pseudomonadota bacterium]|nr:hypothetical protein [Pseudomonadota bacterium]
MRKIDIQDLIQLLGMVGIIGSLIFVGLEMRQSQRIALAGQQALRTQVWLDGVDALSEPQKSFQTLFEMATGDIPITEDYAWLVENSTHRNWWIYENDFVQYDLGLMDENVWQAKLNAMALVYNFCDARPVYDSRRNITDARLIALIEQFPDNCAE